MSKIAASGCIGAFALLLAMATPALAQYDTDPLVDGLPCNALCRWWLGIPSVHGEPAKTDRRTDTAEKNAIDTKGKHARKTDSRGSRTQSGSDKQSTSPTQRTSAATTRTSRSSAANQRFEPHAPKVRPDAGRQALVRGGPSQDASYNQLTPRHNHQISLQKAVARAGRRIGGNSLDEPADTTKVITADADANQPNGPASAENVSSGNFSNEAEQPSPNLARNGPPSDPGPSEIEQPTAPSSRHDGNSTQQLASIARPQADAAAVLSTDNLSAILVTRRKIGSVAELANLTVAIDGTLASAEEAIREAFFAASGAPITVNVRDIDALKRLNDGEVDAAVIGLVSSAAAEASLDGYSVFLLNLRPR